MAEIGDRCRLATPVLSDEGNWIQEGEKGTVVGRRGFQDYVVSFDRAGERETAVVTVGDLLFERSR